MLGKHVLIQAGQLGKQQLMTNQQKDMYNA
jgi:hypothetical protein